MLFEHIWCDAFPRVLPVFLPFLFTPEIIFRVCGNQKFPINVEHQPLFCRLVQMCCRSCQGGRLVKTWSENTLDQDNVVWPDFFCRITLPKSHRLRRTDMGVLSGRQCVVFGSVGKLCVHPAVVRYLANLQYSSDHRRIGEAKNPGPGGLDHVEITIGV